MRLQPLELEMDPTVSWAYKPSFLTCLGTATGAVLLLAYHTENLVVPPKVSMLCSMLFYPNYLNRVLAGQEAVRSHHSCRWLVRLT
jgi:hypothetical protein